ncbi:MAG: amino acid adenylation domain-containing protein, partial [Oscillochloris sp.]|nr:amino acid adenylation domain-containing protein [Oscillochloris sp.]
EARQQQIDYWRQQLLPLPPVLDLPTDRPRPVVQSARGASYSFGLPRTLADGLATLSQQEGATLFMALLAGFQTLLYRYSGQDDICVGSPIANRTRAELESLIGCFINTLVFRGDLSGDPGFRALLRRVREAALGAYAHQDVPFELLVETLQPQRDMSHAPLFQVMFILQNIPPHVQQLPGLTLRQVSSHSGTSTFDLTLIMAEMPEGLHATIEYNTDLFDQPTVAALAGHLHTLLAEAVADPEMPISRLPLLTSAERQQILVGWNQTARPYPPTCCLHELVAAQAARTPDALAVRQAFVRDGDLSYAQLNARANQLAHHLRGLGVGPDTLVGISIPRSPDMAVGLLGILKAGGAYLPLDPAYPAERLQMMLADAQPAVLLTTTAVDVISWLTAPSAQPPAIVRIDADWLAIAAHPADQPQSGVMPEHLAYVIYTSGSTGTPKGVMIPHRAAANFGQAVVESFGLTPRDRMLQFSTISFDAAVEEIFGTWVSGGTLVLRPGDLPPTPAELLRMLEHEQITVLDCSTAYWHTLVAELSYSRMAPPPSLRLVVVGGDAASSVALATWRELAGPQVRWLNTYGPTETTVSSTLYDPATDADSLTGSTALIGRPLPNYTAYILDQHMQPVPVGVAGELYIGGAGVARGYLNRPALTAERFVELPGDLGSQPVERVYRTGDLARYRHAGSIEFLGRADNQVKIRGFRVEPGEIEAALAQHSAVREAIVVARADASGEKHLLGYVLTAQPIADPAALARDLRVFLKARMPDFMLPAAFVALDAWPMTPAGKIDRRALPIPELVVASTATTPLRTPTEQLIAGLWRQLLGAGELGGDANFFALGGHSLLATQLAARIQARMGVELPVRAIFESPTIASLAAQIDQARQRAAGFVAPAIARVPRDQILPLSFSQQRFWFLDQLEPGNPQYNIPDAVRLSGDFDLALAERCLTEIVRRHEVLRSSFPTIDGRPQQVISPSMAIRLPLTDLQQLPVDAREAEVVRLAGEEARKPFDLAHGPLLRVSLLRLDPQEHVVFFTMHHIASDGWSTGVLIGELATLYQVYAAGQPSPLPELSIQYADFAAWQRGWLQTAGDSGETPLQRQLDFWRCALEGVPPVLNVPTDRPRPAVQRARGTTYSFDLPRELTDALNAMSQREGATLFMTLLAAFQVLLHRYSGEDDICIGTPIANRTRAELEPLIGCFINTLVLRGNLAGNPSFRSLLANARATALAAYAHQDVPFEMVVDALQPERNLSHTPLFQVMLLLQNTPGQALRLPGLTIASLNSQSGISPFDMTLAVAEGDAGLSCAFEYSTDLFDQLTIARMAGHFARLLGAVVADPEILVGTLPLLDADELRQLGAWNATAQPFAADRCIHELVAAQAARTPDALAVCQAFAAGSDLTYAELDARANQLAHYLRGLGIGPDSLVAICVPRSPALIIGLLGILKAGGAYLPLDLAYPAERIQMMLADARPAVLLTTTAVDVMPWLVAPSLQPPAILCIDTDWPAVASQPTIAPESGVTPEHLAYVIFTSGSTGTPKGVMVPHRAVVNHNQAVIELFGLTPAERMLQFATITFDAAVEEIFPTLIAGATLVLRPDGAAPSVAELQHMVAAYGVTMLDLPTAYWHAWAGELARGGSALPPSLRLIIVGGEAASADLLAAWLAHGGDRLTWLNTYGPTEGTVIASSYALRPGDPPPPADLPLPIGCPIANTQLLVLDRHMQPVPVGVAGELYIGGAGVARGYLNRPELTAERFVELPAYAAASGAGHWYRTGDLARYRPDGNIEYMGRADSQVKLRGFRVELGEIEATLRQYPGVREAVVLLREDHPGVRRLVAYVVLADASLAEQEPAASLRAFAVARLPDYMLPSVFVTLAALPLTPSGKVNRRALPAPADSAEAEAIQQAPSGATEATLAQIWAEVLGRPQVGVNANFFELGGDSILTIQVIARANAAGIRLTPRQLFEHPTVAGLASVAGTAQVAIAEQGVLTGPLPLTPIQHWFFAQQLAVPQHWNQALMLSVQQPLQPALLAAALQWLLEQHDALRLRFSRDEFGWQQSYAAADVPVPLEWIDLAVLPQAERHAALIARAEALQSSLDLAHGPLLRVAYFTMGAGRADRLLLVVHHLAIDGVSWRILMADLQTVYAQLAAGAPVALPAKTTSFRQWAERLEIYASSAAVRRELDAWLTTGAGPIAQLPVDFPGGDNTEASARSLSVALTLEETQALLTEVPPVYHTEINDVLLTALVEAIAPLSGSRSLLVELEGHGREDLFEDIDLSRTVGWFTTIFPVWLSLERTDGPGAALKAVKEQLRAVPKRGIGYGLLRYLSTEPQLLVLPQPEISFNYLGQIGQDAAADTAFGSAPEPTGLDHDPAGRRAYLIEINASISGGQLGVEWTYSAGLHRPASIQAMADNFLRALRNLITHCRTPEAGGYTPSDFGLANLNQRKLDKVLSKLGKAKGSNRS